MRTTIMCVAFLVCLVAGGWRLTEGYKVWTSDEARAYAVELVPRQLPSIHLIDTLGQQFALNDLTQTGQKIVVLDFFFTRCLTVCSALGTRFQHLQTEIKTRGLQDRVALLSISFDPVHDTSRALEEYAERMQVDASIWSIAAFASVTDRSVALRAFDVVVIPDPLLLYQHNAALHLLNTNGELARILDYAFTDSLLDLALVQPPISIKKEVSL